MPVALSVASSTTQRLPKDAEQRVTEAIASGQIADLGDLPTEQSRTLTPAFLRNILFSPSAGRSRIRVRHAVVAESLNLQGGTVAAELWLQQCDFKSNIDCTHTTFEGPVFLNGSHFAGTFVADFALFKNELNLDSANVFNRNYPSEPCSIQTPSSDYHTRFAAGVRMRGAHVLSDFAMVDAQFDFAAPSTQPTDAASPEDDYPVDFDRLQVEGFANFASTHFNCPVEFRAARFGFQLKFANASFAANQPRSTGADFNGISVGQHIIFTKCTFLGSADLRTAKIAGSFMATPWRMDGIAYFDSASIGGSLDLDDTPASTDDPVYSLNDCA